MTEAALKPPSGTRPDQDKLQQVGSAILDHLRSRMLFRFLAGFEDDSEFIVQLKADLARAAITALMNPTDDMVMAADATPNSYNPASADNMRELAHLHYDRPFNAMLEQVLQNLCSL